MGSAVGEVPADAGAELVVGPAGLEVDGAEEVQALHVAAAARSRASTGRTGTT